MLDNWKIHLTPPEVATRNPRVNIESPDTWSPPPDGVYKLNFDGASKGNPGTFGFEGTIRNNVGKIMWILFGKIVHDSNNAAELEGLIEGIGITNKK